MSKSKRAILRMKHLNSIFSFEKWIKSGISYSRKNRISLNHIEKYLGYIRGKVKEQVGSNKDEWLKQIDKLMESVEKSKNDKG